MKINSEINILSERLNILRKQNNLSQYQLAELLGFSRSLIANYEQGRREPDYNTLLVLASFYKVSVDYLLGRSDNNALISKPDAELIQDINNLTNESKEELKRYIDLLKMRDAITTGNTKNHQL